MIFIALHIFKEPVQLFLKRCIFLDSLYSNLVLLMISLALLILVGFVLK